MFNLVRFGTHEQASEAVASLQAFLVTPSGAFGRKAVPAVVMRRRARREPVLYFSDAALSAANQARIHLPPISERVPRGAVPTSHSAVRFTRRVTVV